MRTSTRVLIRSAVALNSLASLTMGCGGDSPAAPVVIARPCSAPDRLVMDQCLRPGVQDDGCPAGTMGADDGSCLAAGVPSTGCAAGFAHDGDSGCDPILPAEACAAGFMAVPGEASCHAVAPCAPGKWGDIPIEAGTVFVDGSYAGGDSDGTEQRPWTTVQAGVDGAPPGGLVAIAAGSYQEAVRIAGSPVRLWGVCPDAVELIAPALAKAPCSPAAVCILGAADGTEIHQLGVSGDGTGVLVASSRQVVLDRLWIHDATVSGVRVEAALGAPSVTIRSSLIEENRDSGVSVLGASATIESTVVRGSQPKAFGQGGRGVNVGPVCVANVCDPTTRGTLALHGSVIDDNHETGVRIAGSDATIEATVIRRTRPRAADDLGGSGLTLQMACDTGGCYPSARTNATVRGCVVEQNHDAGIMATGADAVIELSVVRDTLPRVATGEEGIGIVANLLCDDDACDATAPTSVTIRSSLVSDNAATGLYVAGASATVEATVVRANGGGGPDGDGVAIGPACVPTACDLSTCMPAGLRGSVVEQNRSAGVLVAGCSIAIDGTLIEDSLPNASDMTRGVGLVVQRACLSGNCYPNVARATMRGSIVDQSQMAGILVIASEAIIESSALRGTSTEASSGLFGDGLLITTPASAASVATASLDHVSIEDSVRAGVANFGSVVSLGNSAIMCAAFALEGEHMATSFEFEDRAGNLCGCPETEGACVAVSASLAPPAASDEAGW